MRKEFKAGVLYPATESVFRISKYSFKLLAFGQALLVVFSFLTYIVCLSICLSASHLGVCVMWANKQWSFNKISTKGSVKHASFWLVLQYSLAQTCCWIPREGTSSSSQWQHLSQWRAFLRLVTVGVCRPFACGSLGGGEIVDVDDI